MHTLDSECRFAYVQCIIHYRSEPMKHSERFFAMKQIGVTSGAGHLREYRVNRGGVILQTIIEIIHPSHCLIYTLV